MKKLYSCLIFGEGKRDKKFIIALIESTKFKYHTRKWTFNTDNAHGCSAKNILKRCQKATYGKDYDLVICLIDLDDLKSDFPKKWEREKSRLEHDYPDIKIIWQINNAEEEYTKVLGAQCKGKEKNELNKMAINNIEMFVNKKFYETILSKILDKERALETKKISI